MNLSIRIYNKNPQSITATVQNQKGNTVLLSKYLNDKICEIKAI